jgi:hypothetical protein
LFVRLQEQRKAQVGKETDGTEQEQAQVMERLVWKK